MELDLHILTYSLLHNTNNMILHLELQAVFFFCCYLHDVSGMHERRQKL